MKWAAYVRAPSRKVTALWNLKTKLIARPSLPRSWDVVRMELTTSEIAPSNLPYKKAF